VLREFWSSSSGRGVHPKDSVFLKEQYCLSWSQIQANAHASTFDTDTQLHDKLHTNLYPQPFIGNLEDAFVYILFGNPGFAISDYADELGNAAHSLACVANLRQSGQGFFPLLPASTGTGVASYWNRCLKSLIMALSESLRVTSVVASNLVVQRVALIEAGAYHSYKFPGDWCDQLPSSRVAQAFVHQVLIPKAQRGEALVFVWRRARFWGVPSGTHDVIQRPPKKARLKNITAPERAAIVKFIARHAQDGT
jgi:hypothetical protein